MQRRTSPPTEVTGRNGILAAMCLALVLVVASVSSVNLALTGISLDLGTSSSQLTWIADGYTVALAALVLPFGALGVSDGRRSDRDHCRRIHAVASAATKRCCCRAG
jgi:MFS family permease